MRASQSWKSNVVSKTIVSLVVVIILFYAVVDCCWCHSIRVVLYYWRFHSSLYKTFLPSTSNARLELNWPACIIFLVSAVAELSSLPTTSAILFSRTTIILQSTCDIQRFWGFLFQSISALFGDGSHLLPQI